MTRLPHSYLQSLEGTMYLVVAMALAPFVMLWEFAARRRRRDDTAAHRGSERSTRHR